MKLLSPAISTIARMRLWTIEQWNDDHESCRNDGIILQYFAHSFTQHPDFILEIPDGFMAHLDQRLHAFETAVAVM